jgi:hypothetical protein
MVSTDTIASVDLELSSTVTSDGVIRGFRGEGMFDMSHPQLVVGLAWAVSNGSDVFRGA